MENVSETRCQEFEAGTMAEREGFEPSVRV